MPLSGKVFVVTGATGGLGPAVVRALLDDGARVAAAGRRQDALDQLIQAQAAGDRLDGRPADLTSEEQVTDLMAWAAERFGGLDGLAAIAGGFAGGTPVHETPLEVWRSQQEVNLTSAFLSLKAVTPHLLRRGGGSIVAVGSRPALRGAPSIAAYSVAKSGVLRLVEAMAAELKDQNIWVNAILPSTIDTPDNRAASPKADYSKWVKPEEIAAVIRWLFGPEARIISGAAIPVYGRA
jgi:NAD(P)-dependent dehydrogenase (short-subunit alcohol dehydrogenase family)